MSTQLFLDVVDGVVGLVLGVVDGVLHLAGGLVLLALSAGYAVSALNEKANLVFSNTAIAVAFLSATMIGITFGYLPARAASRLDPLEALNRE